MSVNYVVKKKKKLMRLFGPAVIYGCDGNILDGALME